MTMTLLSVRRKTPQNLVSQNFVSSRTGRHEVGAAARSGRGDWLPGCLGPNNQVLLAPVLVGSELS